MAKKILTDSDKSVFRAISDRKLVEAISNAIDETDIVSTEAWSNLDALSANTEVDSIEADPDAFFKDNLDNFRVVGTVYVKLRYGNKSDALAMNDSYPVDIIGHFVGEGKAIVDGISVDTSSFYGLEDSPT